MPVVKRHLPSLVIACFAIGVFSFVIWLTAKYWIAYTRSRNNTLWIPNKCKIQEEKEPSPLTDGKCIQHYSIRVKVTVEDRPNVERYASKELGDGECEQSDKLLKEEEELNAAYKNDTAVDCWTFRYEAGNGPPDVIRLDNNGFSSWERSRQRLKAVFITLFAITLTLMFLLGLRRATLQLNGGRAGRPWRTGTYMTHDHVPPATYMPQEPALLVSGSSGGGAGAQQTARRLRPTATEARYLMASYRNEDDIPQKDMICPICLEEFGGVRSPQPQWTVKLPCSHVYHAECALPWFSKGHTACPYCAHDMVADFADVRARREREARMTLREGGIGGGRGGGGRGDGRDKEGEAGSSRQWDWDGGRRDSGSSFRQGGRDGSIQP